MDASPLEFPCDYPVKVMGKRTPEFRQAMLDALGDEAGVVHNIAERPSRDGTYLSLTFTLKVDNREQLDRIYRRLHATGLVLYAL
ncbi:MAG TPA: DUF493 domain-containing protein [Steroidobacteraceae bacterium]|nr:DUF493 domain-containing protein [Steroidobacteraceae bacterium]